MNLHQACISILDQLSHLVTEIRQEDFRKPVKALSQSTIGQHCRHTLEFLLCLEQGYEKGLVNYDKRSHDKLIETDKFIALNALNRVKNFVSSQLVDKTLTLEIGYDHIEQDFLTIQTNFFRELVYNIEHAVHHMAIIKIGINEVADYLILPSDFGVAASTIRYKETTSATYQHASHL